MERKSGKIKRTINYVALTLPEMENNNFNLKCMVIEDINTREGLIHLKEIFHI